MQGLIRWLLARPVRALIVGSALALVGGVAMAQGSPGQLYGTSINAGNGHGAFRFLCTSTGTCTFYTGTGTVDGQSFGIQSGTGTFLQRNGQFCTALPCPRGGQVTIGGNALFGGQSATYALTAFDYAGAQPDTFALTITPTSGTASTVPTHTLSTTCGSCVHVLLYPAVSPCLSVLKSTAVKNGEGIRSRDLRRAIVHPACEAAGPSSWGVSVNVSE